MEKITIFNGFQTVNMEATVFSKYAYTDKCGTHNKGYVIWNNQKVLVTFYADRNIWQGRTT